MTLRLKAGYGMTELLMTGCGIKIDGGIRDDTKTEGGIWDDRTFNDGMRDYNRRRDTG